MVIFPYLKKLQKYEILLLLHEMKNVIEALTAFSFFFVWKEKKISIWIQQCMKELYPQHIETGITLSPRQTCCLTSSLPERGHKSLQIQRPEKDKEWIKTTKNMLQSLSKNQHVFLCFISVPICVHLFWNICFHTSPLCLMCADFSDNSVCTERFFSMLCT